ncbi:MAG: putative toxin-antitoxin system toxin component, PIN family [Pyrinomonadaceae bacterium]
MIVAVFDTIVILQAILNEGGPADECVRIVFDGKVKLVVAEAVLAEVEDVVSRPKMKRKYPQLQTERRYKLIEKLRSVAAVVKEPSKIFSFERDRTDEIFLNLALGFNADFLVSRDQDLLDLRDDSEFTSKYPSLRIVNPFEFLQAVRAQ